MKPWPPSSLRPAGGSRPGKRGWHHGQLRPIHEIVDDLWDRVFRINVTALMRLTRAVVPLMLDAGTGSVVNVASEAGLRGSAAGAVSTASKHAVVGLTKNSAVL